MSLIINIYHISGFIITLEKWNSKKNGSTNGITSGLSTFTIHFIVKPSSLYLKNENF